MADYLGRLLATSADINFNSREEARVLAEQLATGSRISQFRDFQDKSKTANVFP